MSRFFRMFSAILIAFACISMVLPSTANAETKADSGGVIATIVRDQTGKLYLKLNLSETGLGIDSDAWAVHVRQSTSNIEPWVVPQFATNLIEIDAAIGVVTWQIFEGDYILAEGSVDIANKVKEVVDLYTQEGYYHLNGRDWFTTCEPYSQTFRCRTDIQAKRIVRTGSSFKSQTGWVFNNLTYLASARSLWAGNPLGNNAYWTTADGHKWKTECDTALTGRNGCRSFIEAEVIQVTQRADGTFVYGATLEWVFNNIVRFK